MRHGETVTPPRNRKSGRGNPSPTAARATILPDHGVELAHGPVLNRVSMAIDAAVDGQGIVLARTTLTATDLINGRLLRPFAEELRLSKTYWIICPQATTTLAKIVTFRDWLVAQAARDLRQLKKLGTAKLSASQRAKD